LHRITLSDTYTLGRTSLDEGSARRRDLYLYNTQHSKEIDIHAPGGIRSRNPSKRAAADPHLRPRGHCDRPGILYLTKIYCFSITNTIRLMRSAFVWYITPLNIPEERRSHEHRGGSQNHSVNVLGKYVINVYSENYMKPVNSMLTQAMRVVTTVL
jgi:hypothetical protein